MSLHTLQYEHIGGVLNRYQGIFAFRYVLLIVS